jgi:hypothetical protein
MWGLDGRSQQQNNQELCMNRTFEDPINRKSPASDQLASIDELEISPLSDDELDSIAGGFTNGTTAASCACCVAGATHIEVKVPF